ncbi:MAG: phosphoribosylglycinamide synthetase C domain-containing protein, partial [Chloroflexia bacterium]
QMQRISTPFSGVLYAGLMVDPSGVLWVVEFNCRLGDPEAQVLLPRLKTPLEEICKAVAAGGLSLVGPIEWDDAAAVGVVLASDGYPTSHLAPQPIKGLADLQEGVLVFHGAGELFGATALQPVEATPKPTILQSLFGKSSAKMTDNLKSDFLSPRLTATGGRLLTVVAQGRSVAEARETVYRNIPRIQTGSAQYRKDIGEREDS